MQARGATSARLQGAAEAVSYRLQDSRGNEVATGQAEITGLGGFDFVFELSDAMNLGPAYLQIDAIGGSGAENRSYGRQIQVQEFRRPEFEVKVSPSEGPYFVGESATAEVSASYYAGGPLPNAAVSWTVTAQPGSYSPPGWDEFTFGRWVPWWRLWWSEWEKPTNIEAGKTFTGTTDAAGHSHAPHRLRRGHPARTDVGPRRVDGRGCEPAGVDGEGAICWFTPPTSTSGLRRTGCSSRKTNRCRSTSS